VHPEVHHVSVAQFSVSCDMTTLVQRLVLGMLLLGTMYPVWAAGLVRGALFGYGFAILLYLVAQAVTGFRHYLHGALLTFSFAVLYALLVPALSKAS
jgi:hypothetical protein